MKLVLLILPALLAISPRLPAQSLLLVVRETLNGTALSAPYSAREGLAASLFDAGLIIFDLPGPAPAAGLLATAAGAGADYLLEVTVDYASSGTTQPRVDGHAAFTLRTVPGGAIVLRGTLDGTNRDREDSVTRQALGQEIGDQVAQKVTGRLSQPVS
jgi:hypothetical protein